MREPYTHSKQLLKEISKFCEEYQLKPETLATRVKYPGILKRLKDGKDIKAITAERILTQMELERFKLEVRNSLTIRQAVLAAREFLEVNDK